MSRENGRGAGNRVRSPVVYGQAHHQVRSKWVSLSLYTNTWALLGVISLAPLQSAGNPFASHVSYLFLYPASPYSLASPASLDS